MSIKRFYTIFSIMLLIYMIWPGPSKISDFNALPNSDKSKLEGDTVQIPNVSAYFSDNFREFVIQFYSKEYWRKTLLPFPPFRLNYAPEFSWVAIKKHTDTTYLEELIYPLRDSLYINGFEPFELDGEPRWWGAVKFKVEGQSLFTKTTLRFYPSPLWVRLLVWVGIIASFWMLHKLTKRIIF